MRQPSIKIDLHTHSIDSPDGGINRLQYQRILHDGILDVIAITDHNTIRYAQLLREEFGERVIVGEEIMSTGGEIIGLYLEQVIPKGLSPLETVQKIKEQGGIVYIPHPFETFRSGMQARELDSIADYVDIIEICNGRAVFQNRSKQALVWSRIHNKPGAASSDAHGRRGVGRTYSVISKPPSVETLTPLLAKADLAVGSPSIRALLYPKYHRLRNTLRGTRAK